MGVSGLGLDHGGAVGDDLFELLDRQVGVGEGDVGGQEHPVLGDVADLFVHPAVEGPDVGVEGGDVVGELVLDVVGRGGEHEGLVDPLLVHEGQAQVPVAERLGLVAELGDEGLALLVVQALEGVEPVEQHARDDDVDGFGLAALCRVRHGCRAPVPIFVVSPSSLLEFLGGEGDLAGVELGGLAGEELHLAGRRGPSRSRMASSASLGSM